MNKDKENLDNTGDVNKSELEQPENLQESPEEVMSSDTEEAKPAQNKEEISPEGELSVGDPEQGRGTAGKEEAVPEEAKEEPADDVASSEEESPVADNQPSEKKPKKKAKKVKEETTDDPIADFAKELGQDQDDEVVIEGEWYVLHTYSGYEDAVANDLHQRIESLDMGKKIFEVLVPKEKQVEIKNGKRKTIEKKIFPGYVMVRMVYTPDSWFVVRNTQNVTGFIGSGVIPVPVKPEEMKAIRKRMAADETTFEIEYEIGETIHIVDGPFKEYDGTVQEIDAQRGKLKIMVSIFGRETPVELDFLQVKRVGEK